MSYVSPDRTFQVGQFNQVLQHGLEVLVVVLETSSKHHLAYDVGHGIVEQLRRVKWLT
jgi:hypothetical protein